MSKVKIKPGRGGPRIRKKLNTSMQRMLEILWEIHGGTSYIAEILKSKPQKLNNWKHRGNVPLEHVGNMSRILGVSPYALNYEQVFSFNGEGPDWEDVVYEEIDTDADIEYILNAKHPNP